MTNAKCEITKRRGFIVLYALTCTTLLSANEPQEAVCIVPVADLVGEPLSHIWPHKSITRSYQHMSPQAGPDNYRISQLLFNERVRILDEQCGQALISVEHQQYCTDKRPTLQNRYWILKANLAQIRDQKKVPNTFGRSSAQQPTIVLVHPFHDARHARTYSFGTRFVVARQENDSYVVWAGPRATLTIPRLYAIADNPHLSAQARRALFVTLLRNLTTTSACVAYVWGGASWAPTKKNGHSVPTGFDCSSLVMRAAQTAGIYFPWRNSCAISKNLAPLNTHDQPEPGDILWIPGHIMTFSDADKCQLIEARTASHGYGCVHEIPIKEEFKGLNTTTLFTQACKSGRLVDRLDVHGRTLRTTRIHALRLPVLTPHALEARA